MAQLKFVSQPRDAAPPDKYFFDESEGNNVPVYILDTGATIDHGEFTNPANKIQSRAEWLYIDDDSDVDNAGRPEDDSGLPIGGISNGGKAHGTSMLSIIAGASVGVAKQVNPILVRMPRRLKSGGGATNEDWLRGVSKVLDDVNTKFPREDPTVQQDARVVLLMALYWPAFVVLTAENPTRAESGGFAARLYALLRQLAKRGVVITCGTGNQGLVSAPVNGSTRLIFRSLLKVVQVCAQRTDTVPPRNSPASPGGLQTGATALRLIRETLKQSQSC